MKLSGGIRIFLSVAFLLNLTYANKVLSADNPAQVTGAASAAPKELHATPVSKPITLPEALGECALSADGKLLATMMSSGLDDVDILQLWDPTTGKKVGKPMITQVKDYGYILKLHFSPNGELLASQYPGYVCIWNTKTQRLMKVLSDDINDAAFSPDGKTIATINRHAKVRILDSATFEEIKTPLQAQQFPGGLIAYSPDGSKLAIEADDCIQIWNAATYTLISKTKCAGAESMKFTADGSKIYVVIREYENMGHGMQGAVWRLRIVDTTAPEKPITLPEFDKQKNVINELLVISPDGKRLIPQIINDARICVWDVDKKSYLKKTIVPQDYSEYEDEFGVSQLFTADGKKVITFSYPNEEREAYIMQIWDVE